MAIMGSIGLAILYGFKVNASVAIVAMVNHTAVKLSASHSSEADNTTMMNTEVCQLEDTLNITKTANEVKTILFIKIFSLNFFEFLSLSLSLH